MISIFEDTSVLLSHKTFKSVLEDEKRFADFLCYVRKVEDGKNVMYALEAIFVNVGHEYYTGIRFEEVTVKNRFGFTVTRIQEQDLFSSEDYDSAMFWFSKVRATISE